VAELVERYDIACDLEARPAFTYTCEAAMVDTIRAEVAAAERISLPATFTTDTDLSTRWKGCAGRRWRARPHQGREPQVGQDADTTERYRELEDWARRHFPVRSVDYRWSAQDYMPVDRLPFVGSLSPASEHILVATGFQRWGMTNGTAAAMMLVDRIAGQDNPWAGVFDSTRLPGLHRRPPRRFPGVHAPGLHGHVEHGRDHVGLPLPRVAFDRNGRVIQGPAVRDLEARNPPS